MNNKMFPLLLMLILSCLNNLVIPYVIYWSKFGMFRRRKEGFIGVNMWGVIMDGILAGTINMIILNYLLEKKSPVLFPDIIVSLVSGFIFMVACHIFMSVRKWKVWIMPRPWNWNLAGYWHMVSMTLQMSFVAYCLLVILKNAEDAGDPFTLATICSSVFLGVFFLLALHLQTKGVKFGRISIGNKPW